MTNSGGEGVRINLADGSVLPDGVDLELDDEERRDQENEENQLHVDREDGDWDDLAAFAESVEDAAVRGELLGAIEGRGAFSRFQRVVHMHEDLLERWLTFRDDRRIGRARVSLDRAGYRARN